MNTNPIGLAVLLFFSIGFTAICIWTLWPSNRKRLKELGEIPLHEDVDNG